MARVIRHAARPAAVISASVLDAGVRAEQLVEAARARAADIEARARQRGYEAGVAQAAATLTDAAAARAALIDDGHTRVLEVAAAIARHIVGETLAAEPQRIAALVAPHLRAARDARTVVITVHPDDAVALRAALTAAHYAVLAAGDREAAHGGDDRDDRNDLDDRDDRDDPGGLRIDTDANMARGGVIVQDGAGTVDARIETRLRALTEALQRRQP